MNICDLALAFATQKHMGQKRKTGEEYIVHPKAVAELVRKYKKSRCINQIVAAAYLHDVIENSNEPYSKTYNEILNKFGRVVADLVMEVTTIKKDKDAVGKDIYLSHKLEKMTSWALVIKLCDRLDNVSDLNEQDEEFRERYIYETLYIINYVTHHRTLSQTHINIINDIKITIRSLLKQKKLVYK